MGARTGKKILIIENDNDLRAGICRFLESEGYETVSAIDFRDAFRLLVGQIAPNLILFDCIPPGHSGEEFLREKNALKGPIAKIPVLFLFSDCLTRNKYFIREIAGALNKPFDLDELLMVVAKCLS